MAPRCCVISPDTLCFICGEYTVKSQQRNIVSDFVKKVYFAYFKLRLGDHICQVETMGSSQAIRPVPHTSEIPVPHPPSSLDDTRIDSEHGDILPHQDESSSDYSVDEGPQPFSQCQLNDLIKDLGLSKDGAELLESRLKNKSLLTPRTLFSGTGTERRNSRSFSPKREISFFVNDVQGLMKSFDIEYDPSEWRIFIGSSKTSLKTVSLQNGNSFASLPLGHSVHLEENYNDLSVIPEKINYQEYRWMICGDFKMLTMLLGQQAGYTKYPCLLYLSDSPARDLHWTKTDWSLRGA
ncbi:hypothetical protein AVEN_54548-1 [Araneus ventricosus]|uniref:Uncharacterized protein n=1 Tax=Araneus ventricosus TaxID=182803 RepID=A0A4Y2BKU2_ARAVE|nr:hypothetical protein AVEN_54548-1 [Araneus ventricosus]